MLADGKCDTACYVPACGFDVKDCVRCAPGCLYSMIADGECNEACLTDACYQDGGDCPGHNPNTTECSDGCEWESVGDHVC